MSKELDTSWFDIPRKSPEVEVNIGRGAVKLTFENSTVFTYHEPYSHINHVWFRQEDKPNALIFDSEALVADLQDWHFPEVRNAYPDKPDLERYIKYQVSSLDHGLAGLAGAE